MNEITYNVITLDRKEQKQVSLETIKDWYSRKLIHEDTLVCSSEDYQWKTLNKAFNLAEFPPRVLFRQSVNPHTSFNYQPQPQIPQSFPTRQPQNFYQPQPQPNSQYQSYSNQYYQPTPKKSSYKGLAITIGVIMFAFFAFVGYFGVKNFLKVVNSKREERRILTEIKKLEIPGKDFVDSETGARLSIPSGWRFFQAQNNIIPVPDAKMMAADELANRMIMLEIVKIPGVDEGTAVLPPDVLENGIKEVEKLLISESKKYSTISVDTVPFEDGLGKKLNYERTPKETKPDSESLFEKDTAFQGQILLVIRGSRIFILQMWCPKNEYNKSIGEFLQVERSFTISENSKFRQRK